MNKQVAKETIDDDRDHPESHPRHMRSQQAVAHGAFPGGGNALFEPF